MKKTNKKIKKVSVWEKYLAQEIGIELKACLYFFAILFVLIGLMFTGVGILIFLYMKNYRVVFFPGGISYRNEFGKTRQYTDDQIENVLYFRHNVKIKTKDKLIGFNYNCTNYSWALDMVEKYRR